MSDIFNNCVTVNDELLSTITVLKATQIAKLYDQGKICLNYYAKSADENTFKVFKKNLAAQLIIINRLGAFGYKYIEFEDGTKILLSELKK